MKEFIAEESLWELFPQVSIGVLIIENMKPSTEVSAEDQAAIASFLKQANETANKYLTSNIISENEVVKVWREAYQKFKTKKGARSSVESLLKRVLKGNPVGSISPAVDLYNAISLMFAAPAGAEDIDTFVGDIRLGIPDRELDFLPLGEEENDPSLLGEICYYDDTGAICRCWNWRDGQRTAVTDTSSHIFFATECIDPAKIEHLHAELDTFAEMAEKHLGANIAKRAIITKDNPEMVIED